MSHSFNKIWELAVWSTKKNSINKHTVKMDKCIINMSIIAQGLNLGL